MTKQQQRTRRRGLYQLSDSEVRAALPINMHGVTVSERAMADGGGLYLLVRSRDDVISRVWSFLYRNPETDKPARLGLGRYPDISLATARDLAAGLRQIVASGQDPKRQREEAKEARDLARQAEAVTFGMLAGEWLADCLPRWGEGHAQRQQGILSNYLLPALGKKPISAITERDMAQALARIAKRVSHDWAARARIVARHVFAYGVSHGHMRKGDDFMRDLDTNLGGLHREEQTPRAALLTPADLGDYLRRVQAYRGRAGISVPAALQLLPLLAQRPGQLVQMRWSQLDLDGGMWAVPGEIRKMKSRAKKARALPFKVPLPRQAVEILRDLERFADKIQNPYVLRGQRTGRSISSNTLSTALRALGYNTQDDVSAHGFRATFLTLVQEQFGSGHARAADRHLGHEPEKLEDAASRLGAAYDRAMLTDERAVLVQRWADWLDELRDGPTGVGSNVIALPARTGTA